MASPRISPTFRLASRDALALPRTRLLPRRVVGIWTRQPSLLGLRWGMRSIPFDATLASDMSSGDGSRQTSSTAIFLDVNRAWVEEVGEAGGEPLRLRRRGFFGLSSLGELALLLDSLSHRELDPEELWLPTLLSI